MLINKKIPLIFGVPEDAFYKILKVRKAFVSELRPDLAGTKGVAPRLLKHRIQPVVICDNMMAFCMERRLVSRVHIFAYAIKGKIALCRTGSLIAALCANAHRIPVELHTAHHQEKLQKPSSLLKIDGQSVTSSRLKTYVPAFEEVPLKMVSRTRAKER